MVKKIWLAMAILQGVVLALAPAYSYAQSIASDVHKSDYAAGQQAEFSVVFDSVPANIQALRGRITFVNAQATDVSNFAFNAGGTWSNAPLVQDGDNLRGLVNFSQTNVNTFSFRATFNNPKVYVFGFTLEDPAVRPARTLSSTSTTINVGVASQVLGATTSFQFTKNLQYGSSGEEILQLQTRLAELGFFQAQSTGFYGRATQAAVKKFQAARGIAQTGTVGPATRKALNGN